MPIPMQCPKCQAAAALPDSHAGRPVRCKRCGFRFAVPPDAGTAPGQPAVIDRYVVRELLGEGAFGSVYRAFDPRLEREVALKVLRPEMMTSAQAVERFLREAKAAAKLLHPHIVPVHDAGQAGACTTSSPRSSEGQRWTRPCPRAAWSRAGPPG